MSLGLYAQGSRCGLWTVVGPSQASKAQGIFPALPKPDLQGTMIDENPLAGSGAGKVAQVLGGMLLKPVAQTRDSNSGSESCRRAPSKVVEGCVPGSWVQAKLLRTP